MGVRVGVFYKLTTQDSLQKTTPVTTKWGGRFHSKVHLTV